MIYAVTENNYTLIIQQDNDPLNPREDCDPFGHMICWHGRYGLGDKHSYDDPEDLLHDLYRKSIEDGGKRLVSFLKSGAARGAKLEYSRSTHEWDLSISYVRRKSAAELELVWAVEQSAPKSQLNDSGWFFDYMLDALTIDDLKELLAEQKDMVILPLYLYDHGGLAMSTGSFIGRAVHAEWDSGQVGYTYATKEDIIANYGDASPESVAKAEELPATEVESYDLYLHGECYGYRLFMYGHEMDPCWGFLGDLDDVKPDIAACLPEGCEGMVEKLEAYSGGVKEYLYDTMIA